jgi:hypothetical protein
VISRLWKMNFTLFFIVLYLDLRNSLFESI